MYTIIIYTCRSWLKPPIRCVFFFFWRFQLLPWPSPCRGNTLLHAEHRLHDRSCGKSYWSGSWPQSLAARSAKWPQGSSGTHTPQTWRRSSGPSRSKFCGRIQYDDVALENSFGKQRKPHNCVVVSPFHGRSLQVEDVKVPGVFILHRLRNSRRNVI